MSKVLTNGIIIPDNGNRNWGGDLANNWNIIDVNIGYMTDVKNRVTTLENSVAENSANIQINTSNISALQTSKQDVIEDLDAIRSGATAGATAVQPSALNNYVDLSSEQTITGAKTFSSRIVGSIDQAEKDLNGYKLSGVVESGTNYIRYSNGIQVCWGTVVISKTSERITFPKPFAHSSFSPPIICFGDRPLYENYFNVNDWDTNSFTIERTGQPGSARFNYICIGLWI